MADHTLDSPFLDGEDENLKKIIKSQNKHNVLALKDGFFIGGTDLGLHCKMNLFLRARSKNWKKNCEIQQVSHVFLSIEINKFPLDKRNLIFLTFF